jgi:hypothetical protein
MTSPTGTTMPVIGPNPLDGATPLPCPTARQRVQAEYAVVFDLTGDYSLGTETIVDLVLTTSSAAGTARGLYRLSVYEVPRGALTPESNP